MSNIIKKTLSNGVRVLVEPNATVKSAAIGLWCRTGSSHEEDQEAGITHLIEQMDDSERRAYLLESLFLNTVKYENDKLEAYMRKLTK